MPQTRRSPLRVDDRGRLRLHDAAFRSDGLVALGAGPWDTKERGQRMSTDDFRAFLEKLSTDSALRDALAERFGGQSEEVPIQDLSAFAEQHGYGFKVEDVSDDELSDEALSGVSGGAVSAREIGDIKWSLGPAHLKFNMAGRPFSFALKVEY